MYGNPLCIAREKKLQEQGKRHCDHGSDDEKTQAAGGVFSVIFSRGDHLGECRLNACPVNRKANGIHRKDQLIDAKIMRPQKIREIDPVEKSEDPCDKSGDRQ